MVRQSFSPEIYQPGQRSGWDEAYAKFVKMVEG
jgi:hypothetical protein